MRWIVFQFLLICLCFHQGIAQVSRLSFYESHVLQGELILPDRPVDSVRLTWKGEPLYPSGERYELNGAELISFPLNKLPMGETILECYLYEQGKESHSEIRISRLAPKPNSVCIDRLSGGLIVENLPFFPFGFYCYSPVQPTLPEEEVVQGFNLISPYQKITDSTREERRAYMDRCAALGMKVHVNLLSVSGGGGIGSGRANYEAEEKRRLLKAEIEAFKDHPALLAWYISDEPTGHNMPPEPLEETYEFVRSLDPYHPVTIVFMNPPKARDYAKAMDIVMADPYPVPNSDPAGVGAVIRGLKEEFGYEMPVWMVPQAFGGAEWWAREPTGRELRMMTCLGLVEGATGMQYFIRHGLSAFPKSTIAWNECGAMAREIAELSPALFSTQTEKLPRLRSDRKTIKVRGWYKSHDKLFVMAVNTENQPRAFRLILEEGAAWAKANVIFEQRSLEIENGVIEDMIEGYGTRVYELSKGNILPPEDLAGLSHNLLVNPSFEDNPSVGTPAGCYFGLKEDRGATAMVDSRMSHDGEHSVRLVTPADSQGLTLSFSPASFNAGSNYLFSIWAKAAPHTRNRLAIALSTFAADTLEIHDQWQQISLPVTIPESQTGRLRIGPTLSLLEKGYAWIDDKSLSLNPEISVRLQGSQLELSMASPLVGAAIHYRLDGKAPTVSDPVYSEPVLLEQSAHLVATVFYENKALASNQRTISKHHALGKQVNYLTPWSKSYPGKGATTLVDGQIGGSNFREEGIWQAWLASDMEVVVDLGEIRKLKGVSVRCLQLVADHIFLPESISYEFSTDGRSFRPVAVVENVHPPLSPDPLIEPFHLAVSGKKARYVRIKAKALPAYPEGHAASGSKVWLFADEIMIE